MPYPNNPPSPQGDGALNPEVPFLTPVSPSFSMAGVTDGSVASISLGFNLSSTDGMYGWGQRNTVTIPMTLYWNSENGWSGITFVGWQAAYAAYGAFASTYSTRGYYGGPPLQSWLATGNSWAWNSWKFITGTGTNNEFPEPPTGYQPIFSDEPTLRQLVIGASAQFCSNGPATPSAFYSNSPSYGSPGPIPGAVITPPASGLNTVLVQPTTYLKVNLVIAEYADLSAGLGYGGQLLAGGDPFQPIALFIDTGHRGTLASSGLPEWDFSWLDTLAGPFVVSPNSWPMIGQVVNLSLYASVPAYLSVPAGTLMSFIGYNDCNIPTFGTTGISYFVPPGIGFSTSSGLTLNPPNPLVSPVVLIQGLGPSSSYAAADGNARTLIFMSVPYGGPSLFISEVAFEYVSTTGGFNYGLNSSWSTTHVVL